NQGQDDKALASLKSLLDSSPDYAFDVKAKEIFDKLLAKLTRAADAEFKTKNYEGARQIVEKAAVLPNFDAFKQKQYKARIIFEEGKNLILTGKVQDGLAKFEQAKEVDLNIATEVNNWVNTDFIRASKDLQLKKKDFQGAVDKLLVAKQITPENKDLAAALPDAYYELGNSLFNKKDYKGSLAAIKSGLELNKEHKNLKLLYTKWDGVVNSVKNATKKELPVVMAFIEEQYKNAVASDLILGKYKGKKVKWQAKVLGMDISGGKSYGKFQLDNTTFYGLPGVGLDAQRFAASCEESKDKMEAVLDGSISSIEELLGIKYIVVNVTAVRFVEPLE
ncbi:MAG: hypothetical protein PHF84_12675, partial [bacterium]|nr:hypothetical protein [bacterium]